MCSKRQQRTVHTVEWIGSSEIATATLMVRGVRTRRSASGRALSWLKGLAVAEIAITIMVESAASSSGLGLVRPRTESMAAGVPDAKTPKQQAGSESGDRGLGSTPRGQPGKPHTGDKSDKKGKKEKKEAKENKKGKGELADLVGKVGKLALVSAMQNRVLLGINTDVWILPSDCELVVAARATTKEYSEWSKDDQKAAGPPYLMVWDTMLGKLLEKAESLGADDKEAKELKATILNYKETISAIKDDEQRLHAIAAEMRSCRFSRTYKKETAKLEVACRAGTRVDTMMRMVGPFIQKHYKADRKVGPAPASGLEREVRQLLG
eukprot:TRINITY_DN1955_c0_g1_i2.p3 TRINITY_DN1955_c0_g1~~TRINITY_DN1955_c0_g1_i2.p3  ORF type:complete len:323 (+),score=85.56 TRINITY_DN1955_c0_g1_i2:3545-4513(+)